MNYFVKTPWWLKKIFPSYIWNINTTEKIIYLSFDDGPHPIATPFVLDELKQHNAKATFFCIGKNVVEHPDIYERILAEGHSIGNHTHNHYNGWKTDTTTYLADIATAAKHIDSKLFRPPYGRIKNIQSKNLKDYKIIMWDVLSADFDESISNEQCFQNVITKTKAGSIVVFHDSGKAFPHLKYTLPKTLEFFINRGFQFNALEMQRKKI